MSSLQWEDRLLTLADGTQIHGLHARHTGAQAQQRPTLVLLHEALGHIGMWKDFPQRLAQASGLDLFVYERRGYGASSPITLPRPDDYLQEEGRDWLQPVLDAAGLGSVILVGHSDGGSIALVGAACLGERVVAIITEAAHIRIDALTTAGIQAAVDAYTTTNLPERLARYHAERTDLIFRAWSETWLRARFQPLDLSPWLADISCPALIMQGQDDQYGEIAQVEDICAGIGKMAQPLLLAGCGHVPHLEAQDACLDAMCGFIREVLSGAQRPG